MKTRQFVRVCDQLSPFLIVLERRAIISSTFGSSTEKQPQLETGKWKASVTKARQKRKGPQLPDDGKWSFGSS